MSKKDAFGQSKELIAAQGNWQILDEWKNKVGSSKIYTEEQKSELIKLIVKRMDEVEEMAFDAEARKQAI